MALAVLFRQMPGNFLILRPDNPHFTIIEASEGYNLITHTHRDDIIGRSLFEVFPDQHDSPSDHETIDLRTSLLAVLSTKQCQEMPVHRYDLPTPATGELQEKYWSINNKPVITNGEVAYIIHVTEDVTENRMLQISESYFRAIADETPFMVWRCVGGMCDYVNKAWCDFTGLTFNESLGLGFNKAFHPDDVEREWKLYEHAMQNMAVYESKYRVLHKDGNYRWVITSAAPHTTRGNTLEYIGSLVDINDQELAKQRVEESENQLRQLADSIIQMVWVTNARGMHEYYNKRWYEFTGEDFEHTQGEGWNQMFHPDDRDRAWQRWQHSLNTGELYEIEYRLRKYTGEYVWVLGRAAPYYDNDGNIIKWFGTCTDINEQKELQQHKDDFISVASHELKTPLTSLSASLQILNRQIKASGNADPIMFKMGEAAQNQARKLTKLVSDLLNVTKIEQGQMILSKSTFNLFELVAACCNHFRVDGYAINVNGKHNICICADELKIEQVVANFIGNAVKYASQSKFIDVSIQEVDNVIKVAVQDYGKGIDPNKVPHLFDRYYRVDYNGKQYSGLGLGLYISKQIIIKHDGQIGVDSEVGQGANFWFTLPLNVNQ